MSVSHDSCDGVSDLHKYWRGLEGDRNSKLDGNFHGDYDSFASKQLSFLYSFSFW